MTTTTYYSLTHVEQNQSGKYITVNEDLDLIDAALHTISTGGSLTLTGDVTGSLSASVVAAIQGIGVSTTDPTTNQVLQYNGSVWIPATLTTVTSVTMGGDVTGNSATSTVAKLQNRTVAATAPTDLQYLGWNNGSSQWEPKTIAATDLSGYAPLASPTFTGTPVAPTASAGTSTTQLATTAFVTTADALKADLASPTFTGTPAAPTASAGTSTTQLATTAFVTTADALKANLASPTFTGTVTAANLTVSGTLTATFAHDLAAFYPGVLANSAVVLRHVAVRAWSLPTNATGSALSAGTAATGSTTLTLKKNGSSIGTAVISASGTTAAFTVTATSFAALDVLTVEGPATADSTLANVALSLLGSR